MKQYISILVLIYSFPFLTLAQHLTLGEPFNEGMVLQRNAKVNIWGTSLPQEKITIRIQDKKKETHSTDQGRWNITISNLKQGGPYPMTIYSGEDTICINETYVGEVWIAGGQSNMGWTLEKSDKGKTHIANAKNENIRFLLVPNVNYEGHRPSGDMNWKKATTENVGNMSGVAYFFAKELQEKLNVPIGIICCYKGGTAAEVWMSRETLLNNPEHAPIVTSYEDYLNRTGKEKYDELYTAYEKQLRIYKDSVKQGFNQAIRPTEPMGEKHYKRPYGLYHTMFKRILPYTSKGVIWYQGEANAPRAEQYQTLFPALIKEWRTELKNPGLPFLFVQLANYDHPGYGGRPTWAELREAQLKTWQKVKNTAMVVTIDSGEKHDIHPTYKQPVGERLAASALNRVYGYKNPFSGPVFRKANNRENKITLTFDHTYTGLTCEGELKGFEICGEDQQFKPAKAVIENNKVIVYSEEIIRPVAVRYGWSNWTEANLYNKEGFPATPFRTDSFPLTTSGIKSPTYK